MKDQAAPSPQSTTQPPVLPPGHHHGHHHHHHHIHLSKDRPYSGHPSGFASPDVSIIHQPQFLHHLPLFARPPPLHFQHLPPPQAGASPIDIGQQNRQPHNAGALFSVPPPSLLNSAAFVGRAPPPHSNAAATAAPIILPLAMTPYASPPNNGQQQNMPVYHQHMMRPQMFTPQATGGLMGAVAVAQSTFAKGINSPSSNQQTPILSTPVVPHHIPMTHNFQALQNRSSESNTNVAIPIINQTQPMAPPSSQQIQQQSAILLSSQAPACRDPGNKCYLYAAYRVGMLALETLGRRIHDERSYVKYAQNPPYGDDVKFLWKISRMLGSPYVQQFCSIAQQAVVSPFILWDLALETAMYFAGRPLPFPASPISTTNNASSFSAQAPPPSILSSSASQTVAPLNTQFLIKALTQPNAQPLMQRCIQMFYAAAHQKLSHPRFMQSDAEEVCILVRTAYLAFHHSNESFDNFMQSLRRQKACKKDLWNKLLNVLSG
uniref:ZSWIM4-8 C-terminal domain-containing protein n=1 Tax=Romanomermis culicivorax TaxID=13658 RepID=A0A915JLR1_ROMCU